MSYSTSQDQSTMSSEMAQSEPKMQSQASAIPDLVKIGAIPTNTAIEVDTDILDPVVRSDTFCRFQFQNKGILHSHSKISIRLQETSDIGEAFFPLGVGVHSLIERCRLMIGTQTISEIDDYNHYMGYKSLFMSGEHQKEREQVTSGRAINHGLYYGDGDAANNVGTSDTSASFLGLDVGLEPVRSVSGAAANVGDIELRPYQMTNLYVAGPEYQIALADLFPFLYTNQIPLYMLKEPVTVELTFSSAAAGRVVQAGGTGGVSFPIDTASLQLIADYQYFPQEIMEAYAQANSTMSFTYVDYRMAKRTVSSSGTAGNEESTGQTIMNIGGAGRIVSKVIAMLSKDSKPSYGIQGPYHSFGPGRLYTGTESARFNGSLVANIKYNNGFLYPVDLDNSARYFYQVTQAEGMVPFVTREEYSFQGDSLTPITLENTAQNSSEHGLANHFFYNSFHLNRGERVNSRGIEYYFDYDALPTFDGGSSSAYTLRTYVELLKTATITDGMVSTMLA